MSVEIRGADQLVTLSKRLKEAGRKDLEKELSKAITDAIKPLRKALKESARAKLPQGGGLNERVARSRVTTKKSLAREGSGVRVQAGGNKSQLANIDRGRVRHPVYGNRDAWVTQTKGIDSGWWTEPTHEIGDEVRRELEKALKRVADKIGRPL